MAFDKGAGIDDTALPRGLKTPAKMSKIEEIRKAPTAPAYPPSMNPVVVRSAAPGVDQATLMGIREIRLKIMPPRPIAIARAITPDVDSAGDAPAACKP